IALRCGNSSVGRASASQAEGRGFESRFPLQKPCPNRQGFFSQVADAHAAATTCPDGGIGRHAGLKILWAVMPVRVRSPLRAPKGKAFPSVLYKNRAQLLSSKLSPVFLKLPPSTYIRPKIAVRYRQNFCTDETCTFSSGECGWRMVGPSDTMSSPG
ncbi:MAG: hypothetical protein RL181_908, partial [Bacteroidota bacterium]